MTFILCLLSVILVVEAVVATVYVEPISRFVANHFPAQAHRHWHYEDLD